MGNRKMVEILGFFAVRQICTITSGLLGMPRIVATNSPNLFYMKYVGLDHFISYLIKQAVTLVAFRSGRWCESSEHIRR